MEKLTIETIQNGAAIVLFNEALEKVMENVMDDNTESRAKRSVTLKMTLAPTDNRAASHIIIEVVPKLAPTLIGQSAAIETETNTGMPCLAVGQLSLNDI